MRTAYVSSTLFSLRRESTPAVGDDRIDWTRELLMRAALLPAYEMPWEVGRVPTPEPGPGEVLVKVAGAGACHSDLSVMMGKFPIIEEFPVILGHENAGTVAALGSGVEGLDEGEPVAVFGAWGCGICSYCTGGLEQMCDESRWVGHGPPGGYAEYLLVPARRHLAPIGDLDPAEAACLTDAGLTSYRAVRRALPRLAPGSLAVAIGIGGLGHMGLQYLKVLSAARVVAIDPSSPARELATRLGADVALDPGNVDVIATVKDLGEGEGADVVIDFVGSDATLAVARQVVTRRSLIVIVGLGLGTLPYTFLDLPAEVDLCTAYWGSRCELTQVITLARDGKVTPVVERHPLDSINDVFTRLEEGKVRGRAVLIP